MHEPDTGTQARREAWSAALLLSGQTDLRASLLAELAEYLHEPVPSVEARCRSAASDLAQAWRTNTPSTAAEIAQFYEQADAYLYDLTWWHALGADETALVQMEAVETALANHAKTSLEFGCGIGSLSLVMAQHGLQVTLADVNPRLLDYARWRFDRRGLSARFLDLRLSSLPPTVFDSVIAIDVLEHLADPGAALKSLARTLRAKGILFVHFPPGPLPLYPMHLWDSPDVLLEHLSDAELSVERAAGSILVMRRG
jgi:SAM-dependent methyltransferase